MTWKRHPGIYFFIYSLDSIFLMALMFSMTNYLPIIIENSILFFWSAMMFYGMVYYLMLWVDEQFKKQMERDKKNDS